MSSQVKTSRRQVIVIPKVWRSELTGVIFFLLLCPLSLYLTSLLPWSVLDGVIFETETNVYRLKLPLFWLMPAASLSMILYRIYDVSYIATPEGLECKIGRISLNQIVTKVRYEDIRGVEVIQTLLDRFLDIGIVTVATAATGGVEVVLEGVAAPRDIQDTLLAEIDRKQKVTAVSHTAARKPVDTNVAV